MPKPVGSDQRYMPGLDGLRAIAVLTVIFFHENFSWAPGGLLGVGVFFTLSGYLITDILISHWGATGKPGLKTFWVRRARRLLPALFVMLVLVLAWATVLARTRLGSMRGAVAAAATYTSNWYLIVSNQSYFARFAPAQPLDHLWSLAVEEQFYLIWPWLLLAGLFLIRRRWPGAVRVLAIPTLLLAAASAGAMAWLYHPGYDPTRVYEGTDTRAAGLLIGAALAMVWRSGQAAKAARWLGWLLDVPALAGLAVIGLMTWRVGQYDAFLYRGGLVLLSLATVAVIAAVACPASLTGRALGVKPLRWLGVRSYGIYLWHYPAIVLTSPARASSTADLPRAAGQIAATIAVAALSWHFVEEPVRRGAIGRAWKRVRARQLGIGMPRLAAATAGTAVLAVAAAGIAGVGGIPAAPATAAGAGSPSDTNQLSGTAGAGGTAAVGGSPAASAAAGGAAASPLPSAPPGPLRTSCTSVAHIGDSTSEGLVSPDYLPDAGDRIQARYQQVGVQKVATDIVGARSVVETLPHTTNGLQAAQTLDSHGFHGCWVLALGTNDTADIATGSNVGATSRISQMMRAARGEPVMWVNVVSLLNSGPYAEANMQKWDTALLQACSRYPNMRVFNWAPLPPRGWFISDGIHYTSPGYAKRALFIADGLAEAFPAGAASPQESSSQHRAGKHGRGKGASASHCLVSLPPSVTEPPPSPSPVPSATGAVSPPAAPATPPATRQP